MMNHIKIVALITSSFLLLVLLMHKFEGSTNKQEFIGIELSKLEPLASQAEKQKRDMLIDNFKSLRRIVANFINILKGKGIAFQGLEPELDRVLATLKDLETMDLDSVDIGIYEDKYFDMFENIVVKSNEMKKNPLIPENDPEYQVLLDRIKEIEDENALLQEEQFQNNTSIGDTNANITKVANLKRKVQDLLAKIRDLTIYKENLESENKKKEEAIRRLQDELAKKVTPSSSPQMIAYNFVPFVEIYEGNIIGPQGNLINYDMNKGIEAERRKRKLTAYLVIPQIYKPSQLEKDIFGRSDEAIIDIKIYHANKLLNAKRLNVYKNKKSSLNVTDLIEKGKKSKSKSKEEKTYKIEIYKGGKNYTENGGLTFIL